MFSGAERFPERRRLSEGAGRYRACAARRGAEARRQCRRDAGPTRRPARARAHVAVFQVQEQQDGSRARAVRHGGRRRRRGRARPPRAAARALPGARRAPRQLQRQGEVKERREKFLTAKYGSHQMALIRKRLAVEMWLYDELQKLYDVPTLLADAKKPQKDVHNFINELLDKAKTL
ncbi:uncharacterized protein LOC125232877 isoform X2 [Leguminivora glycinivorella]|uniref:uncharacterized protein LOC125232877 isoform X2 n=1 Tax=Leguminivora glycinivorella TaxID=1035111 RepID=UPI00200D5F9E|nr:uncharacterized protein LOC125232877 isoform X2 [Leguminivora glycinivorella]